MLYRCLAVGVFAILTGSYATITTAHEIEDCKRSIELKELISEIRAREMGRYTRCRSKFPLRYPSEQRLTMVCGEDPSWDAAERAAIAHAKKMGLEICEPPPILQPVGEFVKGKVPPHYPFKVGGHCSSEQGCLGAFLAEADIPIYMNERDRTASIALIGAGGLFSTIDTNLWLLEPHIIVAGHDTFVRPANVLEVLSASQAALTDLPFDQDRSVFSHHAMVKVRKDEQVHVIAPLKAKSSKMIAMLKGQQVIVDQRDYRGERPDHFHFLPAASSVDPECRAERKETDAKVGKHSLLIHCSVNDKKELWAKVRFQDIEGWVDFSNAQYKRSSH